MSYSRTKNEFKVGVYLNYDDIFYFRKFRFHHVILNWYFVYNQKCGQKDSKSTFGFFKNLKELEIELLSTAKKLMAKYSLKNLNIEKIKKINNTIKNYIYAGILIKLIKNNEIMVAKFFFFFQLKKQQQVLNQFKTKMQKTISKFALSKMNLKFIKFLIMGFQSEFKKSELKSYNKINMIIKSFQNIFTLIKWISTYNANKNVFKFFFINQNYVSTYMKFKQMMSSLFVEKLSKSKILFFFKRNVEFKIRYIVKFEKHIKNYVIYNEYKMPIDIEFDVDLNLYSNVIMFKNWLWWKLNFQILKINFLIVILMIIKKNDLDFISI